MDGGQGGYSTCRIQEWNCMHVCLKCVLWLVVQDEWGEQSRFTVASFYLVLKV